MCKKRYAFFHAMPCEDECGPGTQDDMLRTVPPGLLISNGISALFGANFRHQLTRMHSFRDGFGPNQNLSNSLTHAHNTCGVHQAITLDAHVA